MTQRCSAVWRARALLPWKQRAHGGWLGCGRAMVRRATVTSIPGAAGGKASDDQGATAQNSLLI